MFPELTKVLPRTVRSPGQCAFPGARWGGRAGGFGGFQPLIPLGRPLTSKATPGHATEFRTSARSCDSDAEKRSMTNNAPTGSTIDPTESLVLKDQVFGDNPLEVRDTDHYTQEYVGGIVDKWDELIDWKRRAEGEGRFFIEQLRKRGAQKVLDVATGTGFHSVRLLEEGFDTVSADGSPQMLAKAFRNGLKHGGHVLRVVNADWRWLSRDVPGEFDAIICLGNSFTHLFNEHDRRKALAEFYSKLKHDGVLIIDQRNYDAIL